MRWVDIRDELPKVGVPVLTYDPTCLFKPKWFPNEMRKDGSWIKNGNVTHFLDPEEPEPPSLTIEELNEIMNDSR